MKRRSGFSLMELIIVIVIIGILIGAVIGLSNQREVAKVSAVEQLIAQTITATNGWSALNGTENYTELNTGNQANGTGYDILVTAGSLPANFNVKKAHPWNGEAHVWCLDDGGGGANTAQGSDTGAVGTFSTTAGNMQNHFVIEINNLPQFACTALKNKFENKHYEDDTNGYPDSLEDLNPCDDTTSRNTFMILQ